MNPRYHFTSVLRCAYISWIYLISRATHTDTYGIRIARKKWYILISVQFNGTYLRIVCDEQSCRRKCRCCCIVLVVVVVARLIALVVVDSRDDRWNCEKVNLLSSLLGYSTYRTSLYVIIYVQLGKFLDMTVYRVVHWNVNIVCYSSI